MRLDRFITLNVVRPWRRVLRSLNPQPSTLNHTWPIPVLMYHSISDDPEPNFSPYYKVNTSPAVFRQHMQLLADLGYRTITISELVEKIGNTTKTQRNEEGRDQETGVRGQESGLRRQESGVRRPSTINHQPTTTSQPSTINPQQPGDRNQGSGVHQPATASQLSTLNSQLLVALTFDDGFRDFYTEAFPILQEFGFTATMFLPTAFIANDRRHFLPRSPLSTASSQGSGVRELSTLNSQLSTASRPCLTWPEVRELRRAGIEFGSHTVNHPKLVDLDLDTLRAELSESKAAIERELHEPITSFCYPYAFPQNNRDFVQNLARLLVETGYRSCATTRLGRCAAGDDPFALRRLPANSLDDRPILSAKLEGSYDWLEAPQGLAKAAKALLRRP